MSRIIPTLILSLLRALLTRPLCYHQQWQQQRQEEEKKVDHKQIFINHRERSTTAHDAGGI